MDRSAITCRWGLRLLSMGRLAADTACWLDKWPDGYDAMATQATPACGHPAVPLSGRITTTGAG